MPQIKSFALKLLYFGIGLIPLAILFLIWQQDLEKSLKNWLMFGIFGITLVGAVLGQRKIYKTGVIAFSEGSTYLALVICTLAAILLFRVII